MPSESTLPSVVRTSCSTGLPVRMMMPCSPPAALTPARRAGAFFSSRPVRMMIPLSSARRAGVKAAGGEQGIIILTGKPVEQEVLTTDGKVLSEGIIILTGRQYVPLEDVARGMGASLRAEKGAYRIDKATCDGCVLRLKRGARR